jgi:hypothetical protein
MSDPATGVEIKNRKWHLRSYKTCFVGKKSSKRLILFDELFLIANLPDLVKRK